MTNATGSIPQEMLILCSMVIGHGLDILKADNGDEDNPACLMFPTPEQGLEFLEQTGHAMNYVLGTNIALTLCPNPDDLFAAKPYALVSWLPVYTAHITTAWKGSRS